MARQPSTTTRVLFALAALLFAPAAALAQTAGTGISLQSALGGNISGGGDSRSISVGFSPDERVELLVSVERLHVPTRVNRYQNGFGVSRGGTTQFVAGEVRYSPVRFNRVSPYVLGGVGRGTARPNVNEYFSDHHRYSAGLVFVGGGVRLPVTGHLSAYADVRCVLQLDTSEAGVFGFLPVRGGLAWRF